MSKAKLVEKLNDLDFKSDGQDYEKLHKKANKKGAVKIPKVKKS